MSNSKLKPRYGIFGAERLNDATFTGRFDFPFTPGTVLHESTLDGIPFDHISDRAIPVEAVLHFYVHDRRFLPYRFVFRRHSRRGSEPHSAHLRQNKENPLHQGEMK